MWRDQVYFPQCDLTQYKDLQAHKLIQDTNLRNIRDKAMNDAVMDTKNNLLSMNMNNMSNDENDNMSASMLSGGKEYSVGGKEYSIGLQNKPRIAPTVLIDPLYIDGFINIRVKPPVHNKGLK